MAKELIVVYDPLQETFIGSIDSVLFCEHTERINEDKTLSFSCLLTVETAELLQEDYIIALQNKNTWENTWFDIVRINKSHQGGQHPTITVDCEHVSYRLSKSEYKLPSYAAMGTPAEILADILTDTDFSVGQVDFTEVMTISINQELTKRELLLQFVNMLGGELSYTEYHINIKRNLGNWWSWQQISNYHYLGAITNNTVTLCTEQPIFVNGVMITQGNTYAVTNWSDAIPMVNAGYIYIIDSNYPTNFIGLKLPRLRELNELDEYTIGELDNWTLDQMDYDYETNVVNQYVEGITSYIKSTLNYYDKHYISVMDVKDDLTSHNNITSISKIINKSEVDDEGKSSVSYQCSIFNPVEEIILGDYVLLQYGLMDIDVILRVVELTYNPYDEYNISFQLGNYVNELVDDLIRIETSAVTKGKVYNGCKISSENGFENIRSDNRFRSYFKADAFAMQTGDGSGSNWTDRLSFVYDEDADDYTLLFNGKLSLSTTAHLATLDAMGTAIAQVLTDAKAYTDGVEASIELSVSSTYETKTAAAQLLLDAKSYADGQVSSASATLSASIGSVSSSLNLFASYADGAYQSKATLSADVVSILSSNFSIIGSGGTATIVDADMYGNDIFSFASYNSAYSNNGYRGYYGEYTHIREGRIRIGEVSTSGSSIQFGTMGYDSYGTVFLTSLANTDLKLNASYLLKLESQEGLLLDSSMVGTALPEHDETKPYRVFLKIP